MSADRVELAKMARVESAEDKSDSGTLGLLGRLIVTANVGVALGLIVRLARHLSDRASMAATDFTVFRTGFWLARYMPARLYDATDQQRIEGTLLAADGSGPFSGGFMAFLNPPHAALLGVLLGGQSLGGATAFRCWFVVNLALIAVIVRELTTVLSLSRAEMCVAAVLLSAFEPLFEALYQGQWSVLLTAAALVLGRSVRERRTGLAAVCLLALSIKPQVLAPFIVLLLAYREARVLVAFGAVLVVAVAVTAVALGPGTFVAYATHVRELEHFFGAGTPIYMPTVRGVLARVLGPTHDVAQEKLALLVWLGGLLSIFVMGVRSRRRGEALTTGAFALSLGVGLITSPHLFVQDVVLWVAVAAWQLSTVRHGTGVSRTTMTLVLATPLWLAFAQMTNAQAASLLPFDLRMVPMALLLAWAWRASRSRPLSATLISQ